MENLNKYKIELEILRDEKDSAEKAAILKTQELQVEIAVFSFTNRKKKPCLLNTMLIDYGEEPCIKYC